jgi:hypothetical protein
MRIRLLTVLCVLALLAAVFPLIALAGDGAPYGT